MNHISGILKIRSGEGRMALLLVGLMLAASAGMGLGGSGIDALFFARFGVKYLPNMYIILGMLTLVTMLVTSALLGSVDQRLLYTRLPLILAMVLVAEWAVLALDLAWFYPVMWLAKGIIAAFQGLFTWGLAGAVCDTRQAKRLFPLFSTGAILGTVIGSSLTPLVVTILHAENLILVWAAALGAAFGIGGLLGRRATPSTVRARTRRQQPSLIGQMRQGFNFVRRSELLSLISVCAALFSVAWFALEFPFNSVATAAFPNEDALAGFLGIFMGINTAAALLLSLFMANRLFARFGIMPMIMVFPAIYLAGFAILSITAPFPLIAAVRFGQIGWAQGVAGTAWQAMFNVIPRQRRDQARAFIDGVPGQLGVMAAGALLIVSQQVLKPEQIYLIGLVTAAVILAVLWRAGRAYRAALVEAVRAGQPHIFVAEEEPFGGFARDAQAITLLVQGVADPDTVTRRISIDMLSLLSGHGAGDALAGALGDPAPSIRAAAIHALVASGSDDTILRAAICLDDPDPEVRAEAVHAMGQLSSQPAKITTQLVNLLDDPTPKVRAWAALGLARRLGIPRPEQILVEMAGGADLQAKAHAIEALGILGKPEHFELVAGNMTDSDLAVRHAATLALSNLRHPRQVDTLVLALGDDDRLTREVVATALGQIGKAAVEATIAALYIPRLEDAAMAALNRLPIGEAAARKIRAYALERASDAKRYHVMWRTVPASAGDERAQMLAESLLGKARGLAIRALRALCLLAPSREDMGLAVENLQSQSLDQQANALEVLESLGGQTDVIRPLIQLWEPADPLTKAPAGYVMHILQDEDGWLRACAALAAGQTDHWEIKSALDALASSDRDPLVRETAAAQLDAAAPGDRPDKLPTMDRILFLRRVPLFNSLAPHELRPIAEIAEEGRYADGEALCRQGEPGERMYVLTSGEVRVMVSRDGSRVAEIARRGPGDVVGEMSIISQEPRIASVVASGEARVLGIAREPFEKLLRERPEISLAVMRVLCTRLREKGG